MDKSGTASNEPLASRIARQGALLFSGIAFTQAFSFARNAIVAHWLSKGDFGIAAAILVLLQLLETLSDIGADRLIVQARDGDDPRLVATAQTTLVMRGIMVALVLVIAAHPMATFFGVPHATWAFAAAAFVPFAKGFANLDSRVAQRRLDNRPQIIIEALPQALSLALTIPALMAFADYTAVLWLAIAQALLATATSHIVAKRRYKLALDLGHIMRLLSFGWPIWVSAFPLVAVYQGDRMLVGHIVGIEGLAAYTAAFMITMVPGLIAARVSNALMLPLLATEHDRSESFFARFRIMAEATTLIASLYLVAFIIAGGELLTIAFGDTYAGLGTLVGWLALMWAMRMLQAVPGAALLSKGITRPFLSAAMIRATGLGLAFVALTSGYGLSGAAAASAIAEFATLAYISWRLNRLHTATSATAIIHPLGSVMALRGALLIPAGLLALGISALTPEAASYLTIAGLLTLASLAVIALAALTMPDGKRQVLMLSHGLRR